MIAAVVTREIPAQAMSHVMMQDSPKSLPRFLIEEEAALAIRTCFSFCFGIFGRDSNTKKHSRNIHLLKRSRKNL